MARQFNNNGFAFSGTPAEDENVCGIAEKLNHSKYSMWCAQS
jgi:hypothetical protein